MASEPYLEIDGRRLGDGQPVFVVAEMSGNHNGDLERALQIVDAVAATGAQAVKIQTYTADTMTIASDLPAFSLPQDHELWGGRRLHDLYDEAHTPWDWHPLIFERAREHGLIPFSTPFDKSAVALLEDLGAAVYKTASAEITDLALVREIALTGKPLIISTGTATIGEIDRAFNVATSAGATQIALLACAASYPASPSEARLGNIALLKEVFGVPVGFSDHTLGIGVPLAAIALGASCIEKHFTLSRDDGGVDSAFSADPHEMTTLVHEAENARLASGSGSFLGATEAEQAVLGLRRSLWVVEGVRAGEQVSTQNVRAIRPAGGLETIHFDLLEGRTFTRDVVAGTPMDWSLL